MADVFISYAREDRLRAAAVADAIAARGWSVWSDRKIKPGESFPEVIERELAAARCVVVLWTSSSVTAEWVQNEAAEGARRRILIPVLLDEVTIPLEFRRRHAADLTAWEPSKPSPALEELMESIAATLGVQAEPVSLATPPATGSPRSSWAGRLSLSLMVAAGVMLALLGWVMRGRWLPETPSRAVIDTATTESSEVSSVDESGGRGLFDPKQSAALFVGVNEFTRDPKLANVAYAADDAVDLAFAFSVSDRSRLVDPSRLILLLSGEPKKPESRVRLNQLRSAGARVHSAGLADVWAALDAQTRAAGSEGILIVTFATQGMSYDDTQYLLTATSMLHSRQTAISDTRLREAVSQSKAARSLILIDACRAGDGRGPGVPPSGRVIEAVADARGQVVLYAGASGQFSYDNDTRRNGVFTAAVLDALDCQAATDERGMVTAHTLAVYVEERVRTWIRENRDSSVSPTTDRTWDFGLKTMPLALCRRPSAVSER